MEPGPKFNIRVYALIINPKNEVLVTDEFRLGQRMTKFPGGGLLYGEGTADCLRREIREEANGQEITRIEHFYTTDFFQEAFFFTGQQLLSIYYTAEFCLPLRFRISTKPFDFAEDIEGSQSFRWVKIKSLNPDDFSFPIDKFVANRMKMVWKEKTKRS